MKVALQNYTEEQIQKMSMIGLANVILADEKKEMNFIDLFHKVAALKQFSDSQKDDLLSIFYTDLNVDGRFTTLGSNVWGLKRWYPVDQTSEKSLAEVRKKDHEDELAADLEDLDEELLDEEELEEGFEDFDDLDYDGEDE